MLRQQYAFKICDLVALTSKGHWLRIADSKFYYVQPSFREGLWFYVVKPKSNLRLLAAHKKNPLPAIIYAPFGC